MAGYNNPSIIELENDCLRSRLAAIKAGGAALVAALDDYLVCKTTRQNLLLSVEHFKTLMK